jgi:hypothetical protein
MNARELRMTDADLIRERDRQLAARRSRSARTSTKRKPGREAREVKRKSKAERRREVYAAVDKRSCGRCEVVGPVVACANDAEEHDHFWGRGKAPETVENVWHVCKFHHDNKSAWDPSRAIWIERFRRHCEIHRYRAEAAKCDRALALEAAQHPTPPAPERAPEETR